VFARSSRHVRFGALPMPKATVRPLQAASPMLPDTAGRARKQKNGPEDRFNTLISFRKSDRAKGFEPSTPTLARECCYALRPVDFRDTISFANLDACREDGFAADRRVPVHLAVDELQCSKAYWKKFERLVTTSRR
jgi:hypothetical protein